MATISPPVDLSLAAGTVEVRDARTRREEAIIAKAEADIDAGLGIEDGDVEAWLNALDVDPDAPIPSGQGGRPNR